MMPLLLFLLALPQGLEEVARTGSIMVDGDVAARIQTARSAASMAKPDPRDKWADADNYDVDAAAYVATKKTLMRLARLCPVTCDVNLWLPSPRGAGRVQIVIRNVNEMSQFWTWGALDQETPAEMKQVLASGARLMVTKRPGMVSALAPVRNSLGDIVGLIEVVAREGSAPQENVF